MSWCDECRQESINPLIGREPWRQARLTDATGPTGPSGVVHDMRAATGSFSALVESNLCTSCVPGVILTATFGWAGQPINFIGGAKNVAYRDGVVTLTTLAADDLSEGVWIKAEIIPKLLVPYDDVVRGTLPFVLTSANAAQTPTLQESSEYVEAEHGMRFQVPRPPVFSSSDTLNYQNNPPFTTAGIEYYSGPVRITAGYGTTTVHDVYSLSPALFVPSVLVAKTTITLALMPFQVQSSTQSRRISAIAAIGVGGVSDARGIFSLPIELPETFVCGGDASSQASNNLHNGISLEYDPSRMESQTLVNQQLLRGPEINASNRAVINDNKTDVIVPADATGPAGQELPVTEAAVHLFPVDGSGDVTDYLSRDANQRQIGANYGFFSKGFSNAFLGNRPDLHDYAPCYALNGPTWHERNIVRYGSALGIDGARHKLTLTFDWDRPDPDSYISFENLAFPQGFVSGTWTVTANIAFAMLGGAQLELLPMVQGRNLMPGLYAAGATFLDPVTLTEMSGTIVNSSFESSDATASVAMEIEPIVHAYGHTDVLSIAPGNDAPPAYTELPLPGQDGMTVDGYAMWLPTLTTPYTTGGWPAARPIAGARLSLRLQAWFKIAVTNVGLTPAWSGNRVVYRRLATPEIFLNLSDAQCTALSNGEEVSVSSVFLGAGSRVDQYKLQFSVV